MPSGRGIAVFSAGLAMWVAARIIGSPGLEVIALGLASLPPIAAIFVRRGRERLAVRRRLSDVRVAPGTRVIVHIEVENRSASETSFLLVEDRLPSTLGRPARLVVSGVPGHRTQQSSYAILPQVRGRYHLGPLTVDVTDPFALVRQRLEFESREELVVVPEVEDLSTAPESSFGFNAGASRARQLFRTGEEYYTMRQYQEGDDLRRLHWPSVARTGELMIRQDESSRRSNGLVFLDTREGALGQTRGPAFERAVSVAATLGALLARGGFSLRLATSDVAPAPLPEDRFLEALASVSHTRVRSIAPALAHLRAGAASDTTFVLVGAPPPPGELADLIRSGSAFGPKLAVLIHPLEPDSLPPDRQAQIEGRATQARLGLVRAGWDCIVMPPSANLRDRWHVPRERLLARSG